MTNEKLLNDDKQKAKEHVEFYYFWLFHYCARNYEKELRRKLPQAIQKPLTSNKKLNPPSGTGVKTFCYAKGRNIQEGIKALTQEMENNLSLSDCTAASQHMKEYVEPLINYLDRLEERNNLAENIYYGHPLSRMDPCFWDEKDFTKVNSLFEAGAPSDRPELILQSLYEDEMILRIFYLSKNEGIEVLGTSGAHISEEGHLRGNIIIKFDLNSPEFTLQHYISQLKKRKFDSFPSYLDAPDLHPHFDDYMSQYEIIKKTTQSSFAVKDDAARAVGLWFWDAINSIKIVDSMANAIRLINKQPVSGVTYIKEEEDKLPFFEISVKGHPEAYSIPSMNVLRRLGYGASDPSVFRRLYRNTQKCIEACEVLSLKS